MKNWLNFRSQVWGLFIGSLFLFIGCNQNQGKINITAADILGNPEFQAMSYGGFRTFTRDTVPTVDMIKEDMRILSAAGIKILRTYNTTKYAHASNVLKAIAELKSEDPKFEMYVMLGAWIECEGAFTPTPNHEVEDLEDNTNEINKAIEMALEYPDIVKIIAVGNEAMIQWATSYFVRPPVILKWVNHLQALKQEGKLPADLWITCSDNFESWGGGAKNYQTAELAELIKAVDYVSLHTYPFHDSHYNPAYWIVPESEDTLSEVEKINAAMFRAKNYAMFQYRTAANYIASLGVKKPIHIGETGWATTSNSLYGNKGSHAADEYKQKLYYDYMREWTNTAGLSCFYFEAFDEKWKDQFNQQGSENHFGLINLKSQAKYVWWDLVDQGVFDELNRSGLPITKTFGGNKDELMKVVFAPPMESEVGSLRIKDVNGNRLAGQIVTDKKLVILSPFVGTISSSDATYPSDELKLNAWEGTCGINLTNERIIEIKTANAGWWGCALEMAGGIGENLSNFKNGKLHFDIKGDTECTFNIGFQSGSFGAGTQVNNFVTFSSSSIYKLDQEWQSYSISIEDLDKGADFENVNSLLHLRGVSDLDGKSIRIKNIFYTQR